jgi:hypothetical protein
VHQRQLVEVKRTFTTLLRKSSDKALSYTPGTASDNGDFPAEIGDVFELVSVRQESSKSGHSDA